MNQTNFVDNTELSVKPVNTLVDMTTSMACNLGETLDILDSLMMFLAGNGNRDLTLIEHDKGNPSCLLEDIEFCADKATNIKTVVLELCRYFGYQPCRQEI